MPSWERQGTSASPGTSARSNWSHLSRQVRLPELPGADLQGRQPAPVVAEGVATHGLLADGSVGFVAGVDEDVPHRLEAVAVGGLWGP